MREAVVSSLLWIAERLVDLANWINGKPRKPKRPPLSLTPDDDGPHDGPQQMGFEWA